MKKLLLLPLLISTLSSTALAAETPEVYLVDMERVMMESIAGKAAKSNFEADAKKRNQKLETRKAEYESMRAAYEKQAALLSEQASMEKRRELAMKERELQVALRGEQEALGKKNQEEVARVVKEARKIVAEMAEKEEMKFVVERNKRFVLFANPDYDITDKVIEKLDDSKIN